MAQKEHENKTYKSTVFMDLFYDDETAKDNILSLYNALYGTDFTDTSIINKIRLDGVLYLSIANDVAFTVNNKRIFIGEHQSTINQNMPLRCLMYIGREYERLVPVRDRYRKDFIPIPTPEFITFYNGVEEYPTEDVLQLSDAFLEKSRTSSSVELRVRVININPDKNHPLLMKCPVLREYSLFTDQVRAHTREGKPMKDAILYCIDHGILVDYLKRKSVEVLSMLIAEYDYEMDMAVAREEAMERGEMRGLQRGREESMRDYVRSLSNNLHVSLPEACDMLGIPWEKYERCQAQFQSDEEN